ncbi:antitoxin MazE-like protein [Jiella sonneratiae]|uniref:DUF3018 family protein n=1 Tax=Jiella sonneratiae TaxID=2816856 RepID=A0ABS3J9U8_9HYPH|nr:antitoxin MazE-like protein [Jiella sonneratiae]MBO0906451.1 DUF3018 family protein [Jiella sonneratiae]
MGRPKELSEEERQKLLAEGWKPIQAEVWVPDWDNPVFRARIEEDCRLIRESDRRTGMNDVLDAFARELWDDLD